MRYDHTIRCCFIGYIVQAIVNHFVSLLLLMFQTELGLSLPQVTSLVTINFGVQLLTDLIAAKYVDRIGYRAGMVIGHICAAVGLAGLCLFPALLPSTYAGILLAVILYAIGGGLLEVLVSPVVEACPSDHKEKTMSLLHSFYCWGVVGVVLVSTGFFALFGMQHWRILALLWAVVPLFNGFAFLKVPIAPLLDEGETSMGMGELFRQGLFWLLFVLMLCAGASEQAVSQWASAFAEQGLGVPKTIGDLAGPMIFGILMGLARLLYGKWGDRMDLQAFMRWSILLCVGAYLLTALAPMPWLNLVGCGLCGFSVGILWPGTFSLAAASMKRGGTAMFGLLALAGDVGCASGPTLVGLAADAAGSSLAAGILTAIVFPVGFLVVLLGFQRKG